VNPIAAQLEAFTHAFSKESPYCKFRQVFYNMVPPGEAVRYGRPANFPPELWDLAQRDNPDPTSFVPVLAVGFDDIQKRRRAQEVQAEAYDGKLREIQTNLVNLSKKHEGETAVKLLEYKRRHLELTHRVLRIMKGLEVQRCRSYPLMPEEDNLRIKLEGLQRELDRPTQFKGRVSELESLVQMLAEADLGQQEAFVVTDEGSLKQTQAVLADQQKGLNHLVSILKQDAAELEIMMKGFKERRFGQK